MQDFQTTTPQADHSSNGSSNFDFEQVRLQTEDYIRREPTKAALTALGAGFILSKLPIGSLIGALLSLLLFSLKPALLISGAIKLYEESQKLSK